MHSTHQSFPEFHISTRLADMDLELIHQFLSTETYWAKNIPFDLVKKAAENSQNFGVFFREQQIGYARVITDHSTIAYLGDVFILSAFRGKGLSKWLMETVMNFPTLQGLRRWILLTSDAHELYRQYGWKDIAHPDKWMEIAVPGIYLNNK